MTKNKDTIKICENIEVKKIGDIKPYWRNPRKNDKTVEALCHIIPKVGFNVPILIDAEGIIIKGHARYRAAVKLGMKNVPCVVSDNDAETNTLDRIADNKISELAEWDVPELRYELEQINIPVDYPVIGFEIPKDEFMEDTFGQEEYNEVKESDFAKAKQNIIASAEIAGGERKQLNDYMDKTEEEQKQTVIATKIIKIKCPCCGKEFVWERNG